MRTGRSNVNQWVNELADPVGNASLDSRDRLQEVDPAATEFTTSYMGNLRSSETMKFTNHNHCYSSSFNRFKVF